MANLRQYPRDLLLTLDSQALEPGAIVFQRYGPKSVGMNICGGVHRPTPFLSRGKLIAETRVLWSPHVRDETVK